MKSSFKKKLVSTLALMLAVGLVAACQPGSTSESTTTADSGGGETTAVETTVDGGTTQEQTTAGTEDTTSGETTEVDPGSGEKISITISYSDNPTLPFRDDWMTVQKIRELANVDLQFEVLPIADYQTRVSLWLNTQQNTPDVIMYQSQRGENASLAMNGAIIPVSDHENLTPYFNETVQAFGLEEALANEVLADGKRYYMPTLYDQSFYDGGLILREDYLTEKGLEAPTTYDELYEIAKQYKEDNPESYPILPLVGARVLYRMTMPSFGVSLGQNASSGSHVLSYNYDSGEFFAGAISDEYKGYLEFFNKLYEEGLLDPEWLGPIDGDIWARKLATGSAFATWAYYDQIGGVEAASEVEGLKLNMFPPLEGTHGAHHQPKSRLGSGPVFPNSLLDREDYEDVIRKIDEIFYKPELVEVWTLGVEGETYEKNGDAIEYIDEIKNAPDGIYKYMQVAYGAGSDVLQQVWHIDREMTKYDENYARINQEVGEMDNAIQELPPVPLFDDLQAEEAASLQTPLGDTFEVWADDFITGAKDLASDWETYVQEMENLGIQTMLDLYNDNLNR